MDAGPPGGMSDAVSDPLRQSRSRREADLPTEECARPPVSALLRQQTADNTLSCSLAEITRPTASLPKACTWLFYLSLSASAFSFPNPRWNFNATWNIYFYAWKYIGNKHCSALVSCIAIRTKTRLKEVSVFTWNKDLYSDSICWISRKNYIPAVQLLRSSNDALCFNVLIPTKIFQWGAYNSVNPDPTESGNTLFSASAFCHLNRHYHLFVTFGCSYEQEWVFKNKKSFPVEGIWWMAHPGSQIL